MSTTHGSLARRTLLNGRSHTYYAAAEGLPLSLKCMFNGRARYTLGRAEFCVDHGGFMVVNQAQPYTLEIASPTCVESFVFWFPDGWAEEVARSLATSDEAQLDEPNAPAHRGVEFFSRYIPNDTAVMGRVREVFAAYKSESVIEDCWLEERLRGLLAAMLQTEHQFPHGCPSLSAARPGTREELYRRLNRGRDFLRAHASEAVTLGDAARIACLSPFHFLRSFKQAFGITPHQFLTSCRIDRAKFLLERTEVPVTAICFDAGFMSLGSFSTLFHRSTGVSPRQWRATHARRPHENRKIREVYLTCRR